MTATVTLANLYNDLDRRLAALANDDSPVQKSRAIVEKALAGDSAIYGVNTGFGILASTRIDDAELGQLQKNLLLSHACGTRSEERRVGKGGGARGERGGAKK